ncbi:MAG: serine hydrolase domain-containing protein [Candidatus Hodarchaeota archaeon]
MQASENIHGECSEGFERVKEVFTEHFRKGWDVGASFAAYLDGKLIVNLWGGYLDTAKTQPWKEDSIINVFSTTKVPTALCVHVLVDQGKIDLDEPVATYWPEFAQCGKENIKVKHILSHSSGVCYFKDPMVMKDLFDWDRVVQMLAAEEPLWEPGTRTGYHMYSFGYLNGELVRRVTGKTIGTFFKEEIADPLGIDFHIGVPEELEPRVADMLASRSPSLLERLSSSKLKAIFPKIAIKTIENPKMERETPISREWRAAEIPSSNGHGNANSIARIGAIIACGGELDGKRVLSKEAVERAMEEQIANRDLVLMGKYRWALGWALYDIKTRSGKKHEYASWAGLGGSDCVMDYSNRLSFAFAMNKIKISLLGDPRADRLTKAVYECLDGLE